MRRLPTEIRRHWNHNTHYYVDVLPFARGRALDVGCGDGVLLPLLAARCDEVVGVDPSAAPVAAARERCAGLANVRVVEADVLTADLPAHGFELVCSFTAIHHLPFTPALSRLASLVAPGGTLHVQSLSSDRSAWEFVAGGVAHRVLSRRHGFWEHSAPIAEPTMTRAQIRAAAAPIVPGARWRRHVLWRWSLTWHAPGRQE